MTMRPIGERRNSVHCQGLEFEILHNNQLLFPKLFSKKPSKGFQMVRMAKLGLVMAPTLSLKVLTNFGLGLATGYE